MKVLAMVMAGGQGTRLHPLTAERSKPAVPFGSRYRIADFVLSSLVNSEIHGIYLLVQYKSQSLIEHVNKSWGQTQPFPGQFVTVVPPQMREGPEWFQGTSDAVFQNINLIERHAPDMVAVFGADHIYRMDVRQMIDFHHQSSAHVSVAAIPIPLAEASAFGIIDADGAGRIKGFLEKPKTPPPMVSDPSRAYGSMGNYLFDTEVLLTALREAKERGEHDFGHNILPRLIKTHNVYAYNFANNRVPGVADYEEQAYWRDVGTIDAYYDAHRDAMGEQPRFKLFNPQWVVNSSNYQGPSARILSGHIENTALGPGSLIRGASVRNSILRREVIVEKDVEIDDCIIMDHSVIRRGSRLRRVIVDRYNNIAPNTSIGFDPVADKARYHVSEGGVVVLPKGSEVPDPSCYQQ
ncbi:glucose-1-phosphate adenylyltransferase [Propionivibrio sp.]|uniref:glucose-1-phosphate adenylyltransferase n=1 Tax=Propionivibrio sp. TaxID=2212460 RepID=UPI0025CC6A5C|nr:glucose-1-phosphate adenylyltransferase [Propionivibrio sp.]MBK7354938.1 glucose-1-phosphate adenylyltransferase [Propionivibrio sp.]MBK8402307.1 glucose-1-phosphate adenylyltransferase [Propionivibrio sp.]MBK8743464.1 glucose-1-phosphate adenylyltransferase [Propionivibrio sp.]MBK8892768.1 glucose-1-phosphate adenylyltransferase [Propionivibrio sp.]MBL0206578.1 glucose-1-phosphate adenylyltransferase [Propionivibrio sp.]